MTSQLTAAKVWVGMGCAILIPIISGSITYGILQHKVEASERKVDRNSIKIEQIQKDINEIKVQNEGLKKDSEYTREKLDQQTRILEELNRKFQ